MNQILSVVVNTCHVNILMYIPLLRAEKIDICFCTSCGEERKNMANILEIALFNMICEDKKKKEEEEQKEEEEEEEEGGGGGEKEERRRTEGGGGGGGGRRDQKRNQRL